MCLQFIDELFLQALLAMAFVKFLFCNLTLLDLGLTCTEQNVITKSGAQKYAAEHGIAFVCPDTSPRKYRIRYVSVEYDTYQTVLFKLFILLIICIIAG